MNAPLKTECAGPELLKSAQTALELFKKNFTKEKSAELHWLAIEGAKTKDCSIVQNFTGTKLDYWPGQQHLANSL